MLFLRMRCVDVQKAGAPPEVKANNGLHYNHEYSITDVHQVRTHITCSVNTASQAGVHQVTCSAVLLSSAHTTSLIDNQLQAQRLNLFS